MSSAKQGKAVAWCNCKKLNRLNGIVRLSDGNFIHSSKDEDASGFFFKTQVRALDPDTCAHCGYFAVFSVTNPSHQQVNNEPKPEDNEHALLWQKAE